MLQALLVVLVIAAMTPGIASARAIPAPTRQQGMLEALNIERARNGVSPLVLAPLLTLIAGEKSFNMVEADYFAHAAPNGETWLSRLNFYGWPVSAGGQILAKVPGTEADSEALAIELLMASPTHRAIIMDPVYTYVGVGATIDPDGLTVFTMILTN